jgi:hypothetical protein
MCNRCDFKSPYEDTINGQCFDPDSEADAKEFADLIELDRQWHEKKHPSHWSDGQWDEWTENYLDDLFLEEMSGG